MVHSHQPELAPLTVNEAFFLVTLGGAQALNIADKIGNFEVGKVLRWFTRNIWTRLLTFLSQQEFDALVVAPFCEGSPIDEFDKDASTHTSEASVKQTLEKWLFSGDDRNLKQIYVCGRPILPFAWMNWWQTTLNETTLPQVPPHFEHIALPGQTLTTFCPLDWIYFDAH